jgi:hypothetical protein
MLRVYAWKQGRGEGEKKQIDYDKEMKNNESK